VLPFTAQILRLCLVLTPRWPSSVASPASSMLVVFPVFRLCLAATRSNTKMVCSTCSRAVAFGDHFRKIHSDRCTVAVVFLNRNRIILAFNNSLSTAAVCTLTKLGDESAGGLFRILRVRFPWSFAWPQFGKVFSGLIVGIFRRLVVTTDARVMFRTPFVCVDYRFSADVEI